MLFFLILSCHIGRPTSDVNIPHLRWNNQTVVSRQWDMQLKQSVGKNLAKENLGSTVESSNIEIVSIEEKMVVDDSVLGQIWSVVIVVTLDDKYLVQEEDRYTIYRDNISDAEQSRYECYERLID